MTLLAEPTPIPSARVIGHRGFAAKAPENTLASIRAAIEAGANAVEFDIRRTKDNKAVVIHDSSLERTTTGTGRVDRTTLAAILKLDAGSWKSPEFQREKIPQLEDALRHCASASAIAVIELKDPGLASAVVATTAAVPSNAGVVVIAFDDRELRRLHRLAPKLPLLWLCKRLPTGTIEEQADYLAARCKKCGAAGVDLDHHLLSEALITALHKRSLTVWCYTVNQATRMAELYAWRIDGITSDRPDLLKKTANEATK